MAWNLRRRAEHDLEGIVDHGLEKWGQRVTRQYVNALYDEFANLAEMPELGVDSSEIRPGYRRRYTGSHMIFYKVTERGEVDIIRVLHASMDFRAHLGADD
jgi:toxin ParE1/3/4